MHKNRLKIESSGWILNYMGVSSLTNVYYLYSLWQDEDRVKIIRSTMSTDRFIFFYGKFPTSKWTF